MMREKSSTLRIEAADVSRLVKYFLITNAG